MMVAPDLAVHPDTLPSAWWRAVTVARRADYADEGDDAPTGSTVTMATLTGDGAALRAAFDRLVAEGDGAQMAAVHLAGWYAGSIGELVGMGLAGARAGLLVEPSTCRWEVHPDGWVMEAVALGRVAVTGDHPWAGRHDAVVLADAGAVVAAAVDALVDAVAPIVEAVRRLTAIGRAGLWNEVGDAVGGVLGYQTFVEPTDDRVALVERAVRHPGAPWRARPEAWSVDDESLGRIHVVRKGGCCLAYMRSASPDLPEYCSSCSFRDRDEVTASHVAWHEERRSGTPS